jgi:AraC-like DNA-binding protein
MGISPRRFIQVFTQQVGITPKLFCRIQRFQSALNLIQHRQRHNWTQLALACGYYDQAHFANEFRVFSGLSPTAYFQVRGNHLNHVPIAD